MVKSPPLFMTGLLAKGVTPKLLPNGLATVLPPEQRLADYDRLARLYDLVVGNSIYNRIIWGNWPSRYAEAARRALATTDGPVLDCACGSLCFTADTYRGAEPDRMVLFDRSVGMLQRAKARIDHGHFLQGDALAMPFRDGAFDLTMAWGLLHIFEPGSPLLSELRRVTAPGGRVCATGLVLAGRKPGDGVLAQLNRRGEAATPRAWQAMRDEFETVFSECRADLKGNMLFLEGMVPGAVIAPA